MNETKAGPKRILLTGGTGFLGSHLIDYLLDKDHELTVLKRAQSSLFRIKKNIEKINLLNIDDFVGGEFDTFIHTASSYGRNGETEEDLRRINIEWPINLLGKLNVDALHFINISTSLPSEVNSYAKTKHEFVKRVRSEFPQLKFANIIAEQFYGPHDGTFISFLVDELKNNKASIDLTKGEQRRDFIYYKDVLTAIEMLLNTSAQGDFPLGTGKMIELKKVVKLVAEKIGNKSSLLKFGEVEYRENEVMESVADISNLESIGWKAEYSFEEGLKETLENW